MMERMLVSPKGRCATSRGGGPRGPRGPRLNQRRGARPSSSSAESGGGLEGKRERIAELLQGLDLKQLENVEELAKLPEDAIELLTAAGYVRQDEWHELYPRMKEKQTQAKREREENFYKVVDAVLSGEREREENLMYEGQDPEEFLKNARDFFETVEFEYEKGSWRNTHLPDILRDRSLQPKNLEDLKASVSYSIPAPTRSREEQKQYRRVERILYTLQDAYLKLADFSGIFRVLEENGFLEETVDYTDPFQQAGPCGIEKLGSIHEMWSSLPLSPKLEFIWTKTEIGWEETERRMIHVEYALTATRSNGSENSTSSGEEGAGESVLAVAMADYSIGAQGRICAISVNWVDEPKQDFVDVWSRALS